MKLAICVLTVLSVIGIALAIFPNSFVQEEPFAKKPSRPAVLDIKEPFAKDRKTPPGEMFWEAGRTPRVADVLLNSKPAQQNDANDEERYDNPEEAADFVKICRAAR